MKRTPLESWIIRRTGISEPRRELLEEYQLDLIRSTVRYTQESSRFYREYLKHIDADRIHSFSDVQSLPFTFPRQIVGHSPEFLCVPQSEVKRIVTLKSSGTSGAEKRIYFSEEDLNLTVDFFKFGMSCLVDKSDTVLVLLPGNSYGSLGGLLKKALFEMGIRCFVGGVITDAEETARCMIKDGITCLVGIPIQILQLSRTEPEAFGQIKKVLLSTDYVPEMLIAELTTRYGCRVFTHYGMTEMGYGGGVECDALNGYHMREPDLYFEIVDPVTGLPVPDGEWGEIVFTTLTRKAMPLIRYRTGDIAAFSPLPCPCGTFLKTMERVRGRLDNRIRIGENEYFSLAELDEIVLSSPDVADYSVCLSADNCIDIKIAVANENFSELGSRIRERIVQYLHGKFGSEINLAIRVSRMDEPNKIANSMTKRTVNRAASEELRP